MNHLYLYFVSMAAMIAVAGTMSLMIYRKLESSSATAMTRMRLHSEKTFKEFKALMWVHGLQALGFFILGLGAAFSYSSAIQIGRIATFIHGVVAITVTYRWWRRFK